jgi:hypothetical protein
MELKYREPKDVGIYIHSLQLQILLSEQMTLQMFHTKEISFLLF